MTATATHPASGRVASRSKISGHRLLFYMGCLTLPMLDLRKGLTLSDILFGLSAVAQVLSPRPHIRLVPGAWKVAAWLILMGAATAAWRANSPLGDYATALRLVYVLIVWPWTTFGSLDTRERLITAIRLLVIGAGISGLVGLLELHGLHVPGSPLQLGRAAGLTQQVNDQGAVLGSACPIAFGLWLRRQVHTSDWTMLAALGGILVGLVSAGSVSGMLAAMVGVAVLLGRGRSLRTVLKSVLIILIAYYVGVHLLGHHGLSPLGRLKVTTSSSSPYGRDTTASRLATWHLAWNQIYRSPIIGRGLDVSSGVFHLPPVPGLPINALQTHNFLLLAWYQGGLLTVIGLLVAVIYGLRGGWRRTDNLMAEVIFASLTAALVFALTGPVLFDRFFWFPLMLLLVVPVVPATSQVFRDLRGLWSSPPRQG